MPVRSTFDIRRMAEAVKGPGLDTRFWITLAVILDVAFDAEHGMFADVRLLSTGENETILVGSDYAGDDFGQWPTLKKNDVVLIGVPEGDMSVGAIYLKRVWSASAKPPKEFKNANSQEPMDASEDPTTVVEAGRTLRIVARDGANVSFELSGSGTFNITAKGGANVNVTAEATIVVDSPDVRLGNTPGSQVARVGDLIAVTIPPLIVATGLGIGGGIIPVTVPPSPPGTPINAVGQIMSGAVSVKA